jgi:hypothetical protein
VCVCVCARARAHVCSCRDALIESARSVASAEEAEQIIRFLTSFIHSEFYLKRLPGGVRYTLDTHLTHS